MTGITVDQLTGSQIDALLMVANEEVETWSPGDRMWPGVRRAIRQLVDMGLVAGPLEGGSFYELTDAAEPVLVAARALEVVSADDDVSRAMFHAEAASPVNDRPSDRPELVVLSSVDQWWCELCGGRYTTRYQSHGQDCTGPLVAVRVLIVRMPDG